MSGLQRKLRAVSLILLVLSAFPPKPVSAQPANQTSLNSLLTEGHEAQAKGDNYRALRAFGEARRLDPKNEIAARGLADTLAQLGAYHGAAAALGGSPDIGLRSKMVGQQVRWGEALRPPEYARRFDRTDKALSELDALIKEASLLSPPDPGLVTRLQRDRIVALRDRERWSDALVAAENLRSSGSEIPPWVREAEADSLLALRRPEEALAVYQEILAADPSNHDAKIGLFFAQVEAEDFSGAFATVDSLAAEGAPRTRVGNYPEPQPNMAWLDAQIIAALARNYAEMHRDAWNRLWPLAQKAPGNVYLRTAISTAAAGRGWERLSDEEIKIAESLDPRDFGIKVSRVDSDLRRGNWQEAQAGLENLLKLAPENEAVKRTLSDMNAHNMEQLELAVQGRHESGTAGNAPGGGTDASAKLYSRPIADNYRLVASSIYTDSKPPQEGYIQRVAIGGGLKGEWSDWAAELLALQNMGDLDRTGGLFRTSWQPTDQLGLEGTVELFSWDTPLRAVIHGIYGNSVGGSATWAWNESFAASARFRGMHFSDDNNRTEESFNLLIKAIDIPHFDLNLRPALYTSQNSERDVPYYNPVNDLSLTLTADAEHVFWRRYEKSFTHKVTLSAGSYAQHGFDTGAIGSASYEQSYKFAPLTEVTYGLQWSHALYDGDSEEAVTGFFRINRRF